MANIPQQWAKDIPTLLIQYTLEGITAKGYDLYAIEHNYCEEYIQQAIEEAHAKGEYTHAYGNINTHLSIQQARAFIEANRKESSEVLELHKSRSFYKHE